MNTEKATNANQNRVSLLDPAPAIPETNPVRAWAKKRASGERSLRSAINAMCSHCVGCTEDHREPGFVGAVRNCTAPHCPLFTVRPYQRRNPE